MRLYSDLLLHVRIQGAKGSEYEHEYKIIHKNMKIVLIRIFAIFLNANLSPVQVVFQTPVVIKVFEGLYLC